MVKYYAVWPYYLPSTKYVSKDISPVFTSKTDAIAYAERYVMANKRRGASVIRCQKGYPNVNISMNGNEFEPHFCWNAKLGKVVHNEEREWINKLLVKKN